MTPTLGDLCLAIVERRGLPARGIEIGFEVGPTDPDSPYLPDLYGVSSELTEATATGAFAHLPASAQKEVPT